MFPVILPRARHSVSRNEAGAGGGTLYVCIYIMGALCAKDCVYMCLNNGAYENACFCALLSLCTCAHTRPNGEEWGGGRKQHLSLNLDLHGHHLSCETFQDFNIRTSNLLRLSPAFREFFHFRDEFVGRSVYRLQSQYSHEKF